MNNKSPFVAEILPVQETNRPTWSVMIPTYNSNDYLAETLKSVLDQELGENEMQIEVVDDASPRDDTSTLVNSIAGNRVKVFVQPKNKGLVGNFTDCIQRSKGKYIHILHGDDYVKPGFYVANQAVFESDSKIGAVINRTTYINGDGSFRTIGPALQVKSGLALKFKEAYFTKFGVNTPAVTVRRDVYEQLGGFDQRIKHLGEDREMWSRISRWYEIGYQVEPLAVYRIHEQALTKKIYADGRVIHDQFKSNEIILSHFEGTKYESLLLKKRESIARNGIIDSISLLKMGQFHPFWVFFKSALLNYPSPKVPYWMLRSLLDSTYQK